MEKKLIVVTGATGNQGRSVVDALLKHGGYRVRGLTRNTTGIAAIQLARQGVEMVSGHLLDQATLVKAFEGAYAVFGVSIPFVPEGEILQGQSLVAACKENNVPLLLWSSLPSTSARSNGRFKASNFDEKSEVEKLITAANQPGVSLHTGAFYENTLNYGYLQKDQTDATKWHIMVPIVGADAVSSWTYVGTDLGPTVVAIVDHWEDKVLREELSKEPIAVASPAMSGRDMADSIAKLTGVSCDYIALPEEVAPAFAIDAYGFGAAGLYILNYPRSPELLRKIGVKMTPFEEYVKNEIIPFMRK